jgi:cell wall-associated NlpC family hydrolase
MADDPRLTPPRGPGVEARIAAGAAPLRKDPRPDAPLLTEAIFGEAVHVYAQQDGWAHVQLDKDRYVGWLPEWALDTPLPATHRVAALRSFVFPGPDIKLPPHEMLSIGSRVAVIGEQGIFAIIAPRGYAIARHLEPVSGREPDYVAVAERFVGTPYLWGGKTSLGLDCSGLVQVALDAAGIHAPRDTDMQENAIGTEIAFNGGSALQRGDLVFWKGHVAIARGDGTLLHANAHHMAVAIEPADEAIARIKAAGSDVTSVRRP